MHILAQNGNDNEQCCRVHVRFAAATCSSNVPTLRIINKRKHRMVECTISRTNDTYTYSLGLCALLSTSWNGYCRIMCGAMLRQSSFLSQRWRYSWKCVRSEKWKAEEESVPSLFDIFFKWGSTHPASIHAQLIRRYSTVCFSWYSIMSCNIAK